MKKITKILSGTLLVALMSFGLATKLNARNDVRLEARDVLTEDFTKSVTGKVVRRAGNEEAQNKISAAKAQIADAGEGKRHIRFVVGLDSVRYADAKFDIVAKDGDTVVKTFADQKVTTAYTHIEAAGVVQSAAQVFGLEYNYLVAFTVNNVPQAAWDYKFEITASVKTEEAAEWTTSEVAEKVITKIAKADEEIAEPAFDWQGVVEGGEEDAFSAENAGKNMTKYTGEGIGFGSYFNTETKSLYIGISIKNDDEGNPLNPEWWAAQLFAVPANVKVGYEYEVSFDLYSPVAGNITVRGQVYALEAGKVNHIEYTTAYTGGTGVNNAPFSLQFGVAEQNDNNLVVQNVDGDANPYVISNFFMREIEKEVVEQPEEPALNKYFRIDPRGTAGAANNIAIYWNDADHAATLKPELADFSVNIGSIAGIDFVNLHNDNVHFNVITGAQSERNVSVVLHTAAGDFKVTIVIVGGAYNSYIVEETECNHTVVEPEEPETPEVPEEPEVPAGPEQDSRFNVIANNVANATNNFTIKWNSDDYKVTEEPTKDDCHVSVGIVVNIELIVLTNESLSFNIVTGAESPRTVVILLHTKSGDFKFSMTIENGTFTKYSVSEVFSDSNAIFSVTANVITGGANNVTIKWIDSSYKPTMEPTKDDCSVTPGIIAGAGIEILGFSDTQLMCNIITGADSPRTVSIILHTAKGDFKITFVANIKTGVIDNISCEQVDCKH